MDSNWKTHSCQHFPIADYLPGYSQTPPREAALGFPGGIDENLGSYEPTTCGVSKQARRWILFLGFQQGVHPTTH